MPRSTVHTGARVSQPVLAGLLAVAVAVAVAVAGCSAQDRPTWLGGSSKQDSKSGAVMYAAQDGLSVHADASTSSRTIARLKQNEKIVRRNQKGAFSLIEARGGSVQGWVSSGGLVARGRSAARPAASAADSGQGDGSTQATATGGEGVEAAEPAQAPRPEPVDEAEPQPVEVPEPKPVEVRQPEPVPAAEPQPGPAPAQPAKAPSSKRKSGASVFDPY
ncbi:MAG TPA: hypothetical protein VGK20_12220 [Candidatus Binatia bacterium]|jgi:hypothetical protein